MQNDALTRTAHEQDPAAAGLHDTIVVGGGPAGVACALRLHQRGRQVLLLEALEIGCRLAAGGYAEPDRQEPPAAIPVQGLARQLRAHLRQEAVPHRVGCEVDCIRRDTGRQLFEVCAGEDTLCARTVVLATGSRPRRDGFLPSPCVGIGPDASTQRIDVQRKRVAILGSGHQALEQAVAALRSGALCVHIYSRNPPPARPHPMRRILNDWIHIGPYTVDSERMTVNGNRYDVFSVQGGYEPCLPDGLELPQEGGQVCVDERGAVPSVPGLYAIGDTAAPRRTGLNLAFAQGVRAAKTVDASLAAREPAASTRGWDTDTADCLVTEAEDALA